MQTQLTVKKRIALFAFGLIGLFATVSLPAGATQSVTLVWNSSTNTDAAGYNIYYGPASGIYTNVFSVGNVTNATVSGLADGTTYYFAAKAYNSSDVESGFSNEASYAVPSAAASMGSAVCSRGGFSFGVTGVSGYKYVVQASTDMLNWVSVATNTAPFVFVDSNAGQFNQRFYRSIYFP